MEAVTEKITVQEAATFLQKAHDSNCPELKNTAMPFVRDNFTEVSQTPAMKEVASELMLEVVMGCELKAKRRKRNYGEFEGREITSFAGSD